MNNQVLFEDEGLRIMGDGTIYVRDNDDDDESGAQLEGEDDGDDDDDDDDDGNSVSVSGEGLVELGALLKRKSKKAKNRKKKGLFEQLFGNKKPSTPKKSNQNKTIVLPGALGVQAKGGGVKTTMTVVNGRNDYTAAGAAQVSLRLQHDFWGDDITFIGSVNGATVTGIWFGDTPIWNTPDGVDVSAFAANNQLRNLLKGSFIKAGLDIRVTGTVPGAGAFVAMITGRKPALDPRC